MKNLNYLIDSEDKIAEVNTEFFAFAKKNGATFLDRELVGASLFEFISDEATARVYQILHHYVRDSERPLRFPYRCDSPDCQRSMEMTISPLPEAQLHVNNRLVREVKREEVTPLSFVGNPLISQEKSFVMLYCSFCNRAALPGRKWTDLAELIKGAFDNLAANPPSVLCQPCSECLERLSEHVEISSRQYVDSLRQFDATRRDVTRVTRHTRERLREVSEQLNAEQSG